MSVLIQLLPVLLPLITKCIDKDGEAKTAARLRQRPGLVQWKVYRAARKEGSSKSEARAKAQEAWEAICECDDDDLATLVAEAQNG